MRVSAPVTLPKPSDTPARKPYKARGTRLAARRLSGNIQDLGDGTTAHRSDDWRAPTLCMPLTCIAGGSTAHNGAP